MNLPVRVWCICVASTLTICFDFFSQDTIRSQSRTVQLYVFLEIIWQLKLQRNSCECLPQECVRFLRHLVDYSCVSRGLPLDGAHQFRQLCSRRRQVSLNRLRAVYGFHLPCSMRQLSKPWSPLANITTSTLSPSVRDHSTMKSCPSISADKSQLRVQARQPQLLLL